MILLEHTKQLVHINLTDKELTFQNLLILKSHWIERRNFVELRMRGFGGLSGYNLKDSDIKQHSTHYCGTPCCLLGLAPEVLEIDIDEHIIQGIFSYTSFSQTHFPYLHDETGFLNPLGHYVFGLNWSNDLDHALERIDNVVNGVIDLNICYTDVYREMILSGNVDW